MTRSFRRPNLAAGAEPARFGAELRPGGVTFSVYAPQAERIELCLFDEAGREERLSPVRTLEGAWVADVPGVGEGQRYGYRAYGGWVPQHGQWFNPRKLLLDPYARAYTGEGEVGPALSCGDEHGAPNPLDSAPLVPRSLVVDPSFDWGGDAPPRTPWADTVIYEAHVRGLTMLQPEVPPEDRGTYRALAAPPVIEHLRSLGVTALELLPIHAKAKEPFLAARGLSNYWGYASIGFFAPQPGYARGADGLGAVRELKQAIRALHAAGIEVILDVVYNHTPEGGPGHPVWSFRGLDPDAYRRAPNGHFEDFTGCGNTVDLRAPHILRLVLDSLRLWVEEYHVDGFRFDLAPALARLAPDGPPEGTVWQTMLQDPVLRQVKLIAEPWDLGPGGYRLGRFPRGWAEWNGEYRDCVRRFWRGDPEQLPELGRRLTGSEDRFWGRGPRATVNYVTCHDGFTLEDLVSYERKHNEANKEGNRDGHEPSFASAWGGPEGPARDPRLRALRARIKRSLLGTLACSLGVPMLNLGDELSRTQRGNNNAYCQDNELSWMSWELDAERAAFLAFVRRVFALRREEPLLRQPWHLDGHALRWLRPDGQEMRGHDWEGAENRAILAWFSAAAVEDRLAPDDRARARDLLLLFNAGERPLSFQLPPGPWEVLLDTADAAPPPDAPVAIQRYGILGGSLVVLGMPREGRAVSG